MLQHDTVVSEEDFLELPEALQRKYFSSLERLRLAQDAAATQSSPSTPPTRRPSTSNSHLSRTQSVSSTWESHRSFLSSTAARRRLQKARRAQTPLFDRRVSEFASLPPTLQRKLFSPEEQYDLASRLSPRILDAADKALYKQQQIRKDSGTSGHSLYTTAAVVLAETQDSDSEDLDEEGEEADESDLDSMDASELESLRWLDEDENLDLRLDDYHAVISQTALGLAPPRRRSFRRGLSLSNVSFRRRSSSSTSLQTPPPQPAHFNRGPGVVINPPLRHNAKDSVSSLDPSATHYRDPTARMKLRVYLASPQKFDEALEFGFPSLQGDATGSVRPKTSPGIVDGGKRTFFQDDTPSLSEDGELDSKSPTLRAEGPQTPVDASFDGQGVSRHSGSDRSHTQLRVVRNHLDYSHAVTSDREMTLHMTLTRPDLRSPDDATFMTRRQINKTPIEQAPLTTMASIWDELPEEPSRLKRFLKKLTSKQ